MKRKRLWIWLVSVALSCVAVVAIWLLLPRSEDYRLLKCESGVTVLAASPNGELLASGHMDGTIRIWSVRDWTIVRVFQGHTGWVKALVFDGTGSKMASGGLDGKIVIWNLPEGTVSTTLISPPDVTSLAITPDGGRIISDGSVEQIRIFDLGDPSKVSRLSKCPKSSWGYSHNLAMAPNDSSLVVVRFGTPDFKLWDLTTGEEMATFGDDNFDNTYAKCVAYSPDGKNIATGTSMGKTIVWDAQRKAERFAFGCCGSAVEEVEFSPDSRLLARAQGGNEWYQARPKILLWDVVLNQKVAEFGFRHAGFSSVAFLSDGRTIAAGSWDGSLLIWNPKIE